MSRPTATPPPIPGNTNLRPGFQSVTYHVKVVTPLFGGGTLPRHLDPLEQTRIRVPSIRGHLRWWYRATLGARHATVDALRAAESAIFGSTSQASSLVVRCKVTNQGREAEKDLNLRQGDRLFPVFPGDVRNIRIGVEFDLTIEFPEQHRLDLEAAIWAWTTLGGIGAKTRRGCGALYCRNFAARPEPARKSVAVQNWSARILADPAPVPWPRLRLLPLIPQGAPAVPPIVAWRQGIEAYRAFRQKGPQAYNMRSFDGLGFAGTGGRMAAPILLRPLVWDDGAAATPMVVPLFTSEPASRQAVQAVTHYFVREQHFVPAGEY